MGKVNVTADLVFAVFVITDEDNCGHTAIAYELLSLGEGKQERTVVYLAPSVRQSFGLVSLLVLLGLSNGSFPL